MARVCFYQTVSVFDHVLQPSQAFALFYQSLIFSGRNLATLKWISIHVGIPSGLKLLMIDTNGDVMLDDALLRQRLSQTKCEWDARRRCDIVCCYFVGNGDQRASDTPSVRVHTPSLCYHSTQLFRSWNGSVCWFFDWSPIIRYPPQSSAPAN